MQDILTTIEIQPKATHQYSIIWMHGLGADGHDFEGLVPELNFARKNAVHFIFPNAPIQPVTVNGGMAMRSWYDIIEISLQRQVDVAGIYQSAAQITQLIDQEIAEGIPAERILLAGFSQGGVIALHTGLRYPQRLAGILALSTYLPTVAQLGTEAAQLNRDIPIFMAHGTADPVVALDYAKSACRALLDRNYQVQWQEYFMQHSLCMQEINDISRFIGKVFK